MRHTRFVHSLGSAVAAVALAAGATVVAQQLPLQPVRESGQGITPAFEGWFQNSDGSYTLLVGYFNRNAKETLEVPVGPNNRVEPGGPDQGQPTHFLIRRQWGVFTVKVPKDFGDKRLTWTITANGQTNSVPIGLIKGYQVEPYKDAAMGNEPPTLRFDAAGPRFTGPPIGTALTLTGVVGQPVTMSGIATDVAGNTSGDLAPPAAQKIPSVSVILSKFRGPGTVTFSPDRPKLDADGKFTSAATFSAPGEYVVRVQANDRTGEGGGGFQCCWTNAHVRVTITAAAK